MAKQNEIRNELLALLGQTIAVASINPECEDKQEMLLAAAQTGHEMRQRVLSLLSMFPKGGGEWRRLRITKNEQILLNKEMEDDNASLEA